MEELISNYAGERISEDKFLSKRTHLVGKLRRELDFKMLLSRKYSDDYQSGIRMYYINACPLWARKNAGINDLIIYSPSQGSYILRDYVRWHNSKYEDEINKARKARKAAKDKANYDKRPDVIAKRKLISDNQSLFISLIEDGMTQTKAAEQAGISISTASRWANNPDLRNN